MQEYEPAYAIDPKKWLALGEFRRLELVEDFHANADLEVPVKELTLHSSIHVIVENQLAMGVDFIPETIAKLIRQGLDRHEAIHAICAIISVDLYDIIMGNIEKLSPAKYRKKLEKITAKRWLKGKY